MDNIHNFLHKIGLGHHETRLYISLLHNGEQTASFLSKELSIPRTTTRGALDRLSNMGIVTKIYKRNTQYYSPLPPSSLKNLLEEALEEKKQLLQDFTKLSPTIEQLYTYTNIVPKVQVFEGEKQLIEAFNMSLYEENKEILIFTSYEFLKNPIIRKNDDDVYIKLRVKKGISARVLVGKTTESSKMQSYSPHELRERRFIPEKYRLPGNIHIYGNSVMYFTAKEGEYLAVLIQSAMAAETLKALFEFMWEQCG